MLISLRKLSIYLRGPQYIDRDRPIDRKLFKKFKKDISILSILPLADATWLRYRVALLLLIKTYT